MNNHLNNKQITLYVISIVPLRQPETLKMLLGAVGTYLVLLTKATVQNVDYCCFKIMKFKIRDYHPPIFLCGPLFAEERKRDTSNTSVISKARANYRTATGGGGCLLGRRPIIHRLC